MIPRRQRQSSENAADRRHLELEWLQRYQDADGILMTYPFHRAYTVSSATAFDAFRTACGLAVLRHYPLNENVMEKKVGYFVCDVEYAGPYCMLGEARAPYKRVAINATRHHGAQRNRGHPTRQAGAETFFPPANRMRETSLLP